MSKRKYNNKVTKFAVTKNNQSNIQSEIKDIKTEGLKDPESLVELPEDQQPQVTKVKHKALDGWDTKMRSVYIEQIPQDTDDIINVYKLKDTRRIFMPISGTTAKIHYVFDTLFNLGIKFDIHVYITEDESREPNTIVWTGEPDEEVIITKLSFVNWNKIFKSGAPFSAITGRKHILSFSQDSTEMVEIYAEAAITSMNNESVAIDMSIYAKLTPDGVKYIEGIDKDV